MVNEIPNEGGTYILNPKTGKAELVQQTQKAEILTEEITDGITDKTKTDSN